MFFFLDSVNDNEERPTRHPSFHGVRHDFLRRFRSVWLDRAGSLPYQSINNQPRSIYMALLDLFFLVSQFRTLTSSSECLFSLVNGDDMYVTFSVISKDPHVPQYIVWFSRAYLYAFVSLFIYIVLNLFIAVILETYELLKVGRRTFL